jgi:hypothetical protein
MVQPTGGYLRESGSARSFHHPASKNPNNDNFRKIKTIPAKGEYPSRMSALRQAMVSADVRLAIEDLDDTAADSFEQRLEAELGRRAAREDNTERDEQKIEQVNAELDKACREIAREAQVNLRIGQLMNERDREVRTEPVTAGLIAAPKRREKRFSAASAARRMMLLGALAVIVGGGWAARDSRIADELTQRIAGTGILPALAATVNGEARTASENIETRSPGAAAKAGTPVKKAATDEDWRSGLSDRMGPAASKPAAPASAEKIVKPVEAVPQSKSLPVIRTNTRPTGANAVRIVRAVPETARTPTPSQQLPEPAQDLSPVAAAPLRATAPAREAEPKTEETARSRQPEKVELALNSSRGLDTLSAEQRDMLMQKLVGGECLADALGSVFTRVPILTMRDLVRQLEGAC